jgi:hypothetical protein
MTEEIKIRQTAEEATSAVPAGQEASTVDARYNAERKAKKPIVSWAALLDEAVKKPGFIHEAYTRFHSYSIGNQLLALFQCSPSAMSSNATSADSKATAASSPASRKSTPSSSASSPSYSSSKLFVSTNTP